MDLSIDQQKPRVVEERDSSSGVISAVEAGTGVAIGADTFGHSFGNRVKLLHITPEPKPISVGIAGTKADSAQPRKNSGSAPKKQRHPQRDKRRYVRRGRKFESVRRPPLVYGNSRIARQRVK
jgi:hypothetical protein